MPSFTFVSTANAFALRGAKIVFADVEPDTMNLDPACVRAAITSRTRAIVPVHYAGVCCDMDALNAIAREHGLAVVEDAAQAVGSFYKGRPAGSMSDVGCFSFHETKNYSMGEGGAVILNDPRMVERAEIIREKGTDRSRFYRGQVDKYTWVDIGSSFLPSELNAAYLLAQLEQRAAIAAARMARWEQYEGRACAAGGKRSDRAHEGACRPCPQCPYVLHQAAQPGGALPVDRLPGRARYLRRVPLHPAALRRCGPQVRPLRRGGPLHHRFERAAAAPAHVL